MPDTSYVTFVVFNGILIGFLYHLVIFRALTRPIGDLLRRLPFGAQALSESLQ
jgi:uncharacterized membrane protein